MPNALPTSYRRGTMKTYSRLSKRRFEDDAGADPKRQRFSISKDREKAMLGRASPSLNTSSSPTRTSSIFSDPLAPQLSSPLSSPPSALFSPIRDFDRPSTKHKKHRVRALGAAKRRAPLEPLNPNSAEKAPAPKKSQGLTQLQIDLGGDVQKVCKSCGMEYVPSNLEDEKLHKKFHSINIGGVEIGRINLKRLDSSRVTLSNSKKVPRGKHDCLLIAIDRKSGLLERKLAINVLEVVNNELTAVDIDEEILWGTLPASQPPLAASSKKGLPATKSKKVDIGPRFRVFLCIKGQKCVGLCLAERISRAYKVLESDAERDTTAGNTIASLGSSIAISEKPDPAILGISRIWTTKLHRGQGVAAKLLDCARENFIYGMVIPKGKVAFSQPSESGGKLAQSWFKDENEWHVYVDE
ncbi:MAG: N-acetyltransferase O1 (Establishment of cohesion protein 1) [Trizodia sp. TS-e1964]|nr:MAG: N-acetyltransferase O1 (Establishment of cohesion protein 1) [Trizodia sp. TS-e1964]